jgi:hypothetical protein
VRGDGEMEQMSMTDGNGGDGVRMGSGGAELALGCLSVMIAARQRTRVHRLSAQCA